MATVQRCASCTAPLAIRDEPPGATVRCRFCGADNQIGTLPAPARAAPPEPPPKPALVLTVAVTLPAADEPAESVEAPALSPKGRRRLLIIAGVVLAAVMGIVVWALTPMSLDRLSETPSDGEGWITISAPTPPGDFARFDVTASVAWAQRIGRAWARDAVLTYVNVDALRRDGTADVVTASTEETSGPGIWYHFASPARIADYHRRATRAELKVNFALQIQVRDGRVQVLRSLDTPTDNAVPGAPPPAQLCPLSRAVATLVRQRKLPERPMYSASLNGAGGYAWNITTRDRNGSAMVRADTCGPR